MRAAHAEERRGAKGTRIPLMSLAQGGGGGSAYTCIYEYVEGNITVNKRLCLSTAALTLLSPFAAFADEPTGPTVWDGFSGWLSPDWSRDFSATVGVKIWINDWQRDSFLSSGVITDSITVDVHKTPPPTTRNPTSSRSRSLSSAPGTSGCS